MWNDLNLPNPVHDICEYNSKDAATLQDLPELVDCLTTSAEILTKDDPIWEEIQILKNIQAKYKRILHCDKCLQLLQRVGGCVKKMILMNLSQSYIDLGEKIVIELQKTNNSSHFLPSRQQLEYILIRTQSAAKLMCEALHYSRETFCYLIQKLKIGHLIIHLMMATSVTAKLHIFFKELLVHLFNSYKKLYPWRKRLRKGGWEWSKTLELPADLENWINLKESEYLKTKPLPNEQLDFLTKVFDKKNSRNGSIINEDIILLDDQESLENIETTEENECVIVENDMSDCDVDNGVLVARSEIESNGNYFQNSLPSTSSTNQRKEKGNKTLTNVLPSTSSTNQRKIKGNKTLTNAQKTLLKKIRAANDMKTLKVIWNNLDLTSQDLLPQGLTAEKTRLIDKVFLQLKHGIAQVKNSKLTDLEKEAESKLLVKAASIRFAKHLKVLPEKKGKIVQKNIGKIKLKPVNTCKGLKELYETIYQQLQAAQEYETCAKLKKCFKRRKADIKLLIENEEKIAAKRLIFSSSKFFISKFLK